MSFGFFRIGYTQDYKEIQEQNRVLREALEFYARVLGQSKSMDRRIVHQDSGDKAKQALDQTKEKP